MEKASFTRIDESTRADWEIVERCGAASLATLAERVLEQLTRLGSPGTDQPFQITRLQHSLQAATRAERDGAEEELVVATLLHDIGDDLAPYAHADFAATILKPYVSERTHWIIEQHDVFQGKYYWDKIGMDPNAREKFRSRPWFDACEAFCRDWDCPSFDPEYDTLPLEHFVPAVRRIFARTPYSARGTDN
ncbi:HD domain-containing protein [Saccharopolyspora tripterygii]